MCCLHSNLRRVRFPEINGCVSVDDLSKSIPRKYFGFGPMRGLVRPMSLDT